MNTHVDDLDAYKWRGDLHLIDHLRQEGYDWLISQGIDPATVLIGGIVVKAGDQIKVEVMVPDETKLAQGIYPIAHDDGSIMTDWNFVTELPPEHLLIQVGVA